MPANDITYQPASGQLMAAYRPIVFKVQCTATEGGTTPPYVVCDIYIENVYYKSIIRTSPAEVGVDFSLFGFDISRDIQEYLQPDIATIQNATILQAPHMSANIFCRFRASDVDENGFTVEEGAKPIQATRTTPAESGDGLQSETFFAINAALQHENNQNLAAHLDAYKTGGWSENTWPLSHRLKPMICPGDSDHFPIIANFEGCKKVDFVLHYKLKGDTEFTEVVAPETGACEPIEYNTSINGNQVTVSIGGEGEGQLPEGWQAFIRYKKQSSDTWIDAGIFTSMPASFYVNGADIAGDYDIEVIYYCTACDHSEPVPGTFTLSGEVISLAWRGINPFCVQQPLDSDIYIVLENRDPVTTNAYFPNEENPFQYHTTTKAQQYAKFYSDAAHLTPMNVTATGLKIYIKKRQALLYDTGSDFNNSIVESLDTYTVNPAGVNEIFLGEVTTMQNIDYFSPYPTVTAESDSTYSYSPFPTHLLTGGNNVFKGYATLQQYNTVTDTPTGVTKPNDEEDPDYIAPVSDGVTCPAGPQVVIVAYGAKLEVAKVEIKYAPVPTYVYAETVSDTDSGGYFFYYAVPKNVNVNITVKVKTLDSGNVSGVCKVNVNYVDGGGTTQSQIFNVANNVETALPMTFQNVTVINISNY